MSAAAPKAAVIVIALASVLPGAPHAETLPNNPKWIQTSHVAIPERPDYAEDAFIDTAHITQTDDGRVVVWVRSNARVLSAVDRQPVSTQSITKRVVDCDRRSFRMVYRFFWWNGVPAGSGPVEDPNTDIPLRLGQPESWGGSFPPSDVDVGFFNTVCKP
jgi:hypothetical protein